MDNSDFAVIYEGDRKMALPLFEGSSQSVFEWLSHEGTPELFEIRDRRNKKTLSVNEFRKFVMGLKKPILPVELDTMNPKFYVMDPKTEDLLPNGKRLTNGMRVLAGSPDNRERIEKYETDWVMDRLLEQNRWCTVSDLEVGDTIVSFVAVYEDGTKRLRVLGLYLPWLVKLDSIPEEARKYNTVYESVKSALDKMSNYIEPTNYDSEELDIYALADKTTKRILGII